MKYISFLLLVSTILTAPAFAHEHETKMPMPDMGMSQSGETSPGNTVKLLFLTKEPLAVGKQATVNFSLRKASDGKNIGITDLEEAHTKKIHLLIIDHSLTDYHHVHPTPLASSDGYTFNFTPKNPGPYRLWADIVPTATGKQEYIIADLEAKTKEHNAIIKTQNDTVDVGDLTFKLAFDAPLKAGNSVMGRITITQNGKAFDQLEPVMATYAHIVGFHEDGKTVVHIHPMGAEPAAETDRGGPELQFHMEPAKPGFSKLFVQIRVKGQDIFAPFGVMVSN